MDNLTFISKIIDSLAWPITVIFLVIALRDEIAQLIPFLKKLKAGPLEAEFERDVNELRKATSEDNKIDEISQSETASKNFLIHLAELHPRSAILESWVRLEAAARSVLKIRSSASSSGSYLPAAKLADALGRQGALNSSQIELFEQLRRLRNEAAHLAGFDPSEESACSYIDLAVFLQGYLEGISI